MKSSLFTLLNPQDKLFESLKDSNPIWWQFVKDNIKPGGFYVDVRKDNSLNIYYNGGSLLKIIFSNGAIKGKIHSYYLGKTGAKYVDYKLDNLPDDVGQIKRRIESKYGNLSENGIKARLICYKDSKYIDSEFAHYEMKDGYKKHIDNGLNIRIDLIKLDSGKIIFVELKRIEDNRLLSKDYENGTPEIISQLSDYKRFIRNHKEEITNYYKKLFIIKRDMEILPSGLIGVNDINDYELCDDIELYIESYSFMNTRRIRRVSAIKSILDKHNIIHNL